MKRSIKEVEGDGPSERVIKRQTVPTLVHARCNDTSTKSNTARVYLYSYWNHAA